MATIKKAQNGIAKDKTSVKTPNAVRIMKGDNEIAERKERNKAKLASYKSNNNVSAALMYGDEKGALLKSARTQDSIAKAATKKAINLKNNPRFKLKNGGSIAKDGKWIQKATASIKKRGTAGKCTPITKPGCTGKAKTLALTFKKIAKAKKKK